MGGALQNEVTGLAEKRGGGLRGQAARISPQVMRAGVGGKGGESLGDRTPPAFLPLLSPLPSISLWLISGWL
jgi:hypothetical protein